MTNTEAKSKLLQKLDDLISPEFKKEINDEKIKYTRIWAVTISSIFAFQQILHILDPKNNNPIEFHYVNFSLTVILYALYGLSFCKDKLYLSKYLY